MPALGAPFGSIPDTSSPRSRPADVLLAILTDGGGGGDTATLVVEAVPPMLEVCFRPGGDLQRASHIELARLIGGRTMHSGQGMEPGNPMRATPLALIAQSQHIWLPATHAVAGSMHIGEHSPLRGVRNHAAPLHTTYA